MGADAVEVKSITLKVDGKELTLSVEKARALLAALRGLLEGSTPISVPYPLPMPYPVYVKPAQWHPPYWTVCCTGTDVTTGNVTFSQISSTSGG